LHWHKRLYAFKWGERVLIFGDDGRLGQVTPPGRSTSPVVVDAEEASSGAIDLRDAEFQFILAAR
jgi:hypothetical protein